MAKEKAAEGGIKIISENRKARFNYHIIDKYEAGMVLTGAEIKSVRAGGISLAESFVVPERGELYLQAAHIKPYSHDASKDYDPLRKRKLLLHRTEIDKLRVSVEAKGLTIVPLKIYLKNGYAKLEIALAKGKSAPDKRDTIKERESVREMDRAKKGSY